MACLLACLQACLLAGLSACAGSEPTHWNVLVIGPDTIRADHLSVNGYAGATTPNLDRLAAEGVDFRQAITVAPRTWQSFASILTGLYPPRHGVRHVYDDPLRPDTATMATALAAVGYRTAALDAGTYIRGITDGRGFGEIFAFDRKHPGIDLTERFIAWMTRASEQPFFGFVWLPGAHWPYVGAGFLEDPAACEHESHAFNFGRYGISTEGHDLRLAEPDSMRRLLWTPDPTARARAHRIAHYDAEVRETDALIDRLVAGLREAGALDRTIVVVTSDHGESFGEHGYLQHGPRVDEPVMRVPLILRLPPAHPAHQSGRVVDELVRVVDLFPTLLDAIGEPVPEGLDGRSLLPLLTGDDDEPRWVYGESGRSFGIVDPERYFEGTKGKHRMIRTSDWKLVHVPKPDGGEDRLYDLRNDPGERTDVAADHPDVVARLRAKLDAIGADEPEPKAERALSEEQRENLRALGYAD